MKPISKVYGRDIFRSQPVGWVPDDQAGKSHLRKKRRPRKNRGSKPVTVPAPLELQVPTPIERVRDPDRCLPSREGQTEFRAMVIEAYGACAVTGCTVEAALEAAHIIPFVDTRSHRIDNALCLRADVHALYDRCLILIAPDGTVTTHPSLRGSEYRQWHDTRITMPKREQDKPCSRLLGLHERFSK